jgi:DNA-directed RNA polymerase alpha subunit
MKAKIEIPTREEIDPNGLFSDKQHEALKIFLTKGTWSEAGNFFGIKWSEAEIMCRAMIAGMTEWQLTLSTRTCNALNNSNIYTKKQALAFIANGCKARNFGKKSMNELCVALKLPQPEKSFNWGINNEGEIIFPRGACISVGDLEKILGYAKKAMMRI